jgi:endonuclease-8
MPEGHTVHRTANDFNRHFRGQEIRVDSPQGRFSADAGLIDGKVLKNALAIGKQLFLSFDNGLTLRIHLGIYGKWRWQTAAGLAKSGATVAELVAAPVIGEVRARFYTDEAFADLRGPTVCEVVLNEQIQAVYDRLGPDPLNPVGRERFIERIGRSKQAIGQLLMDQSVVSGIGNVYRAELLFRAGIDPYTPGSAIPTELVEALWDDSVKLLKVGVKTGFMITRDELFTKRPSKAERNFVYKRENQECRVCGTQINLAMMQGRKLYWCPSCQK